MFKIFKGILKMSIWKVFRKNLVMFWRFVEILQRLKEILKDSFGQILRTFQRNFRMFLRKCWSGSTEFWKNCEDTGDVFRKTFCENLLFLPPYGRFRKFSKRILRYCFLVNEIVGAASQGALDPTPSLSPHFWRQAIKYDANAGYRFMFVIRWTTFGSFPSYFQKLLIRDGILPLSYTLAVVCIQGVR